MRPPHEIKRGQRGAKPGIPRKSRSTDDEGETYDAEVMESVESEFSEDDSSHRMAINHHDEHYPLQVPPKISPETVKQELKYSNSPDNSQPSPNTALIRSHSLSPKLKADQRHMFPIKGELDLKSMFSIPPSGLNPGDQPRNNRV